MTPKQLIQELLKIEDQNANLCFTGNNINPEDDQNDIHYFNVEIHWSDTEQPTLFLYNNLV